MDQGNHRGYVGPAESFDLVGQHQFDVLLLEGLEPQHTLLDYGCGSLRAGKHILPYLEAGNYTGFEPEAWVLSAGLAQEALGLPGHFRGSPPASGAFDYILAHSIFTHTHLDELAAILARIACVLAPIGRVLATYLPGTEAQPTGGWVYPGTVAMPFDTLRQHGERAGLLAEEMTVMHPRDHRWVRLQAGHRRRREAYFQQEVPDAKASAKEAPETEAPPPPPEEAT